MALSPRLRTILASLAIVAGLACLLAATTTLFVRVNVWDREGFAANAAQALQNEDVRVQLSRQLAAQLVENGSEDLIAAQPALELLLPDLVGSPVFLPVLRRAAAEMHRTLFARDDGSLVLDLADVGSLLVSFLQIRRPGLVDSFPTNLTGLLVQVTERDDVIALVSTAETVSWMPFVFVPLALALLGGGIAFARDRRRALTATGMGVALVGLVFWVGIDLFRSSQLSGLEGDERDAAAGVLDAFVGSAGQWALVLGVAGALLTVAALAAWSTDELNARLRTLWRRAVVTPPGEGIRTFRALLLVALGALVLLRPAIALQIALAAIGFYLVVLGLLELVRQVERVSSRGGDAMPRRWLPWTFGAIALAAIAVGLAFAFTRSPGVEPAAAEARAATACNGHDELCDRRVDEVAFAASHNSMSATEAGFINANQAKGIVRQLDDGVRAFLIDAYDGAPGRGGRIATDFSEQTRETAIEEIGPDGLAAVERLVGRIDYGGAPLTNDRPYLCHVVCELGATDAVEALTGMREWLDGHPGEVVIVFVQDEGVTPAEMELVFTESGLIDLVYTHPEGAPWPTLRELIDSGQRVIVLAENVGAPGTWYHQGFDLVQETPYDNATAAALASDESCRPNRGDPAADLFLLNHWVAVYPPKPSEARKVNAYDFLLDRARRCQEIRGKLPNLVAVDFYDRGDLVAVVDELNGL